MVEIDSDKVEAEVARWQGLGSHGLVGTTHDGGLKVMIPGHNFGPVEIKQKVEELLRLTKG